jgi:hypothetical protein
LDVGVKSEEHSIWFLWLLLVFSYLCVVVRCRVDGGLQQHSCEVELSWNVSAGL